MGKVWMLLRSAVFLVWLSITLATLALSATFWAVQAGVTAARVTGQMATAAAKHKKEMARVVARTRAKARLRRLAASVPILGLGTLVYFEESDYREWSQDHPTGTRADYACGVARLSAEVVDEVLGDLPELLRPSSETVSGWLPECDDAVE